MLRESAHRVLGPGELFTINDCSYIFELDDYFSTPHFEEELSGFMQEYHSSHWSMSSVLSPKSVGRPVSVGKYYCSPSAFAQGTFGKVSAGWTQDGTAVAIKVFKNPNESEIRSHEQFMGYIGKHV